MSFESGVAQVDELREEVAVGCRVLGAAEQSDLVWGHLSARDPDGRGVWMKAGTYGFEEIDAAKVLLVDRDGDAVEGDGRRHAEHPIHTEIMAARPNISTAIPTRSSATPGTICGAGSGEPGSGGDGVSLGRRRRAR